MGKVAAIVGSRNGLNWDDVAREIKHLMVNGDISLVVSGGALGVDRLAESIALAHGKKTHTIRPDWDKYGRSAGFRRNVAIVEMADVVYAFWDGGSKGTAHSINIAERMKNPCTSGYAERGRER